MFISIYPLYTVRFPVSWSVMLPPHCLHAGIAAALCFHLSPQRFLICARPYACCWVLPASDSDISCSDAIEGVKRACKRALRSCRNTPFSMFICHRRPRLKPSLHPTWRYNPIPAAAVFHSCFYRIKTPSARRCLLRLPRLCLRGLHGRLYSACAKAAAPPPSALLPFIQLLQGHTSCQCNVQKRSLPFFLLLLLLFFVRHICKRP